MRFTPDLAIAFGDWLELDQIRHALVAARPELTDSLVLDSQRPLLRIHLPGGGMVVVARMADSESTPWVVGISGTPASRLHELRSADAVVTLTLSLLPPPFLHPSATSPLG